MFVCVCLGRGEEKEGREHNNATACRRSVTSSQRSESGNRTALGTEVQTRSQLQVFLASRDSKLELNVNDA